MALKRLLALKAETCLETLLLAMGAFALFIIEKKSALLKSHNRKKHTKGLRQKPSVIKIEELSYRSVGYDAAPSGSAHAGIDN